MTAKKQFGGEKMALSSIPLRNQIADLHVSPTLEINEHVLRVRKRNIQILHMGFGQSPFPVHPLIKQAVARHADKNMYLPSAGLPELREVALKYYTSKLGLTPEGYTAIIGPGSKELMFDVQLAVAGDLLLPIPSWVSYAPQAALTGDKVIRIPTTLEKHNHLTAEALEHAVLQARKAGHNPRKLILNSPNNPTGLSLAPDRLAQLAEVCRKYSLLVISDELYGQVHYRGAHVSIAKYYPEGTIVSCGVSKHISLGGYRLGVALIPTQLSHIHDAVVRIASETWSTVSAPIQYAMLTALGNDPEIETYHQTCTRIHSMVSGYVRDEIVAAGIPYPRLDGAFYMYPDFEPFREPLREMGIETSDALAKALIDELHLATLPGTAFGDAPERLTLRLAHCDFSGARALEYYAAAPDCSDEELVDACCPNIVLACSRLSDFLSVLRPAHPDPAG